MKLVNFVSFCLVAHFSVQAQETKPPSLGKPQDDCKICVKTCMAESSCDKTDKECKKKCFDGCVAEDKCPPKKTKAPAVKKTKPPSPQDDCKICVQTCAADCGKTDKECKKKCFDGCVAEDKCPPKKTKAPTVKKTKPPSVGKPKDKCKKCTNKCVKEDCEKGDKECKKECVLGCIAEKKCPPKKTKAPTVKKTKPPTVGKDDCKICTRKCRKEKDCKDKECKKECLLTCIEEGMCPPKKTKSPTVKKTKVPTILETKSPTAEESKAPAVVERY